MGDGGGGGQWSGRDDQKDYESFHLVSPKSDATSRTTRSIVDTLMSFKRTVEFLFEVHLRGDGRQDCGDQEKQYLCFSHREGRARVSTMTTGFLQASFCPPRVPRALICRIHQL